MTKEANKSSNLIYRPLEITDHHATATLIARTFSEREPMSIAMQLTEAEFYRFAKAYLKKVQSDDISIVVEEAGTGRIIGFSITEDLFSTAAPDLSGISDKFNPIFALLESLCDQYKSRYGNASSGRVAHVFMIGVDATYAKSGITSEAVRVNLAQVREAGYTHVVTEATGNFSQAIFKKLGFHGDAHVNYESYDFQGGRPFQNIARHPECLLMSRDLNNA